MIIILKFICRVFLWRNVKVWKAFFIILVGALLHFFLTHHCLLLSKGFFAFYFLKQFFIWTPAEKCTHDLNCPLRIILKLFRPILRRPPRTCNKNEVKKKFCSSLWKRWEKFLWRMVLTWISTNFIHLLSFLSHVHLSWYHRTF